MKQAISILFIAAILHSCVERDKVKKENITAANVADIKPGAVATTSAGYSMNAKINGSPWSATSMMPPDIAGRIVGYYAKNYIGLPYSKTDMAAGKKILINEDNAADLSLEEGCLYSNPNGEIEITKADESLAEGKFSFTTICTSTKEEVKVTDGFFRILLSKK